MSSLVRRSLRTTVAAAGIAAGVGLAGPAFAAPAAPAVPVAPAAPAAPEVTAPEGFAAVPELPSGTQGVPGILEAEVSRTNAAAPALPSGDAFIVPAAPVTPAAPGIDAPETGDASGSEAGSPINNEDGTDRVNGPSPDNFGQGNVGALQGMDMAAFVMEMAQGDAAGGSMGSQQIG